MPPKTINKRFPGFTLSELLIALAILGVIATFTIPKVLQSQQDSRKKAIAKEAAATISAAYQAYKQKNTATGSTSWGNIIPYINYVKYDTASTNIADDTTGLGAFSCTAWNCIHLHNGAIMNFSPGQTFNNTASTNAMTFILDPDGTYSGSTTGSGKGIQMWLYYNGRIIDGANIFPNTCSSDACDPPSATFTPAWFRWD